MQNKKSPGRYNRLGSLLYMLGCIHLCPLPFQHCPLPTAFLLRIPKKDDQVFSFAPTATKQPPAMQNNPPIKLKHDLR